MRIIIYSSWLARAPYFFLDFFGFLESGVFGVFGVFGAEEAEEAFLVLRAGDFGAALALVALVRASLAFTEAL